MSGSRSYSVGTERALYLLSRGYCYAPQCPERVLRNIDGNWFSRVHIAHIYAHKSNGPRFNEKIPSEERRRFHNLLLLCKPHHELVDSKAHEKTYTVTILKGWKQAREGENTELLSDIHEEDVHAMLMNAVTAAKDQILAAINTLSAEHDEVKALLVKLMEESFDRPYMDENALSTLEYSARLLGPLEENAGALGAAAHLLAPLEENALTLKAAAENLGTLETRAADLTAAASRLEEHGYMTERLVDAADKLGPEQIGQTLYRLESWNPSGDDSIDAESMENLIDRVNHIHAIISNTTPEPFFNEKLRNGIIVGFTLALLLAIVVVTIVLQTH